MANNLLVKDANGTPREIKTLEAGGVHTPIHHSEGPLTNVELRATPLPVLGPATNTELRATPLSVAGPLTDGQLRANPINVAGPLTDGQLRATAVDVKLPAGSVITALPSPLWPLSSRLYAVSTLVTSITNIPAGAVGARIFPIDHPIYYNLNADPAVPSTGAFSPGGFILGNTTREQLWTLPVASLRLVASESVSVWIEFLKKEGA
jgi:hypothetical protein